MSRIPCGKISSFILWENCVYRKIDKIVDHLNILSTVSWAKEVVSPPPTQSYFQVKLDAFKGQLERHEVHSSKTVQMNGKRQQSLLAQDGGLSTHIFLSF